MNPKLLNGMLELLMLEVISNGPSYGYQIVQTVLSRSGGRFEMKEGSLYPALHRLERQKFLRSYWRRVRRTATQVLRTDAAGKEGAGGAGATNGRRWRKASAGFLDWIDLLLESDGVWR